MPLHYTLCRSAECRGANLRNPFCEKVLEMNEGGLFLFLFKKKLFFSFLV
jgi:hypothetical protein